MGFNGDLFPMYINGYGTNRKEQPEFHRTNNLLAKWTLEIQMFYQGDLLKT